MALTKAAATTAPDNSARGLYEKLEDRILARDQVANEVIAEHAVESAIEPCGGALVAFRRGMK